MGTSAAGMNDALGHALTIETGKLFDEVRVFQQDRAGIAGGLGMTVLADRRAIVARELHGGAAREVDARRCSARGHRCRAGLHPRGGRRIGIAH